MRKLLLTALIAGSVIHGAPSASACHFEHPANLECWDHSPPPSDPPSMQASCHGKGHGHGRCGGGGGGGEGSGFLSTDEDYRGGCSFVTLNDTTPGGQLGGANVWNGVVEVDANPVHADPNPADEIEQAMPEPTWTIDIQCLLRIDGGAFTKVISASGTGSAANTDQLQFTAASGSNVEICDLVTVNGVGLGPFCFASTETPLVPEPVQGVLYSLFDQVGAASDTVEDVLDDSVVSQFDPTVCSILITLAPTVNGLGLPEIVHIDPEGDLHATGFASDLVWGDPTDDRVWDCQPYE